MRSMLTLARFNTLALAFVGAVLFWWVGLPLPFIFGPMTACLIAALAGMKLQGFGAISVGARTILGVAVGASITPDVVHQLPQMAASLAFMPFYVVLIAVVGVPFFNRVCGFDPITSYYAAMPGGLQDMVIFGGEAGADVRALSLIHATRVLVIVTLAPIVLVHFYGVGLSHPIGAPMRDVPLRELGIMVLAALVGWKGGEAIGLFGASILGPMIVTAALSLGDIIHMRPPAEAILTAQLFIGTGIGVFYVGVTLRELRNVVASGVAFVLFLAVLTAVFTELVTLLGCHVLLRRFWPLPQGGRLK